MEVKTLNKLDKVFEESGVLFAYLFGSKSTGTDNADSDTDIAVMLSRDLSESELFKIRLDLIHNLSKSLKEDVDVVVLNQTKSLLMRYMIVSKGKRIFCSDIKSVLAFESLAYAKYFDFRPFLEDYRRNYVKRYL